MKDVSVFTTYVTSLIVLGGFVACCAAQPGVRGGTYGEFIYSLVVPGIFYL